MVSNGHSNMSVIETNLSATSEHADVVYWFYGGYVVLIFVLGVVQNTVTVYVFVRDKRLQLFHNYYIVGLAIADVGMCFAGHWMIVVSAFYKRWYFGRYGKALHHLFL